MTLAAAAALRTLALAALWWALAEGETSLWTLGVPGIAAALAASLVLAPPRRGRRIRPAAAVAFAAAFLAGSARGGTDVALRALRPRPRLAPAFAGYRLRLPAGAPRHLFAATVSLLPGTLSARLAGDVLTVHVLDDDLPLADVLERLEERTAALFGLSLPRAGEPLASLGGATFRAPDEGGKSDDPAR